MPYDPMNPMLNSTATFSPCRAYRYSLWRRWGTPEQGYAMFIGLNPSTADEVQDDPTIRRCIQFAKDWGYGGLVMANLFAFRATKPADMKAALDPVGPENDVYLQKLSADASVVVAAWGTDGTHLRRGEAVREMLPNLYALGFTKVGQPRHPLYLSKKLTPIQWTC